MARQAVQHMDGMCLSSRCTRLLRGPGKPRERSLLISHMDAYPSSPSYLLHRKTSTKSCRESLPNDSTAYGHETLLEQIYGFAEFLSPVLPSYQPLSLVVDGLENISSPTPYRNPNTESECSPRLGR